MQIPDRDLRAASLAAPILFFAAYAAWVCWLLRGVLWDPNVVPLGDLAADDMLILRAKHFALLHGNYSRVGFYHPGPFFLQIAALGETVFHDWLGWVKSYHAAQVLALDLLQGVALAFAFRLWLLVTCQLGLSLLAVLVLMATVLAGWSDNVFAIPWNPHAYVAAAIWLATGMMGMLLRGPRWLPLAVLGAVALLHGHASFIGLLPVSLAAFALAALGGRLDRVRCPTAAEITCFIRTYPWSVAASAMVILAGALPIVANTVLNWPGEIPKYFAFAGHSPLNNPFKALKYVWTFLPLSGVWLLALARFGRDGEATPNLDDQQLRRAGMAVFVAGAVPALLYSLKGVDNFAERYLILWVTGFFGMAAAAAMICSLRRLSGRVARAGLSIVVASAALWLIASRPEPQADPAAPEYEAAARAAEALASPGVRTMLVVNHDDAAWMETWREEAAVNALLLRSGSRALCVDPGTWVLPFGLDFRCDVSRDRIGRTLYFGLPEAGAPRPVLQLPFMAATPAEPLPLGEFLAPNDFFRYGISYRADAGAATGVRLWADGPKTILAIDAQSLPRRVRITLLGRVVGPSAPRVAFVDAAGSELAETKLAHGQAAATFDVDVPASAAHAPIQIRAITGGKALMFAPIGGSAEPRFELSGMRVQKSESRAAVAVVATKEALAIPRRA